MKITAPAAANMAGEQTHYYGVQAVKFIDGVAEVDSLSDGAKFYLLGAGYTVDGEKVTLPEPPTPVDARDLADRILVGTELRDAAVDPQPEDFLPPVNAGTADPHGPEVVAPGIHAEGERVVRSGAVRSDPEQQSADESAFAEKILVNQEPITAPFGGDWKGETGRLGLSDPGSTGEQGDASTVTEGGEPKGNASRNDWAAYAAAQGAPAEETDDSGLSRDELRAKYGS